MANASDVSRTSPSGTIATRPAALPRTASSNVSWLRKNSLNSSSKPAGIITQVRPRRICVVPCWSSEWTRLNRRAWACSRAA